MKKHIPNILTLANLFCGCLAIGLVFIDYDDSLSNLTTGPFDCNNGDHHNYYFRIFILVGMALLFDFLDGLAARLLHVKSALGAQLDSLADMVTFGVLPGFVMMSFLNQHTFLFLGLFITLFSALRLAKFNIDNDQEENFKGLAAPANTVFIVSLAFIDKQTPLGAFIFDPITLIGIVILSCFLLVSNIPMFSFKMKNFNFSENIHRYLLLIISVILLMIFQLTALPLIIISYILLSLIFKNKFV